MKLTTHYETLYSIGVIWNVSNKFYRQMMKEIAIGMPVIQIRKYQLGDRYIEFVRKCYEEYVSEEYLSKKIDRMDKTTARNMVVFVVKIDNPEYHYDDHKKKYPCTQVTNLKRELREKYREKVEDYFYDVVLHMTDENNETKDMLRILKDYEDCVQEDFIRKGYVPYIKSGKDTKKHDTYASILKSIENVNNDEER